MKHDLLSSVIENIMQDAQTQPRPPYKMQKRHADTIPPNAPISSESARVCCSAPAVCAKQETFCKAKLARCDASRHPEPPAMSFSTGERSQVASAPSPAENIAMLDDRIRKIMQMIPHFGETLPHQTEMIIMLVRELQWAKIVERMTVGSYTRDQASAFAGRDICMIMLIVFGQYLEEYPDILPSRDELLKKLSEYSERIGEASSAPK